MKKNKIFVLMSFLSLMGLNVLVGMPLLSAHQKILNKACKMDADRFCKSVETSRGDVGRCLHEHHDELSDACKEKIQAIKERMEEKREACKDDVEKFCPDIKPGKGRIKACLKGYTSELSEGCRKEWHSL